MARCSGFKPDDSPCERIVGASQTYCYAHDPARADERKRAASRGGKRGGRGRPMAELQGVKGKLEDLAEDVLQGRKDRGDAAVAGQLYNTLIRAIGMELKVKEQLDLLVRLEELESLLAQRKEEGRWGA
jgi:hypothetical protein